MNDGSGDLAFCIIFLHIGCQFFLLCTEHGYDTFTDTFADTSADTSAHTFVSAATDAVMYSPLSVHTFVSATAGAVRSGGNYAYVGGQPEEPSITVLCSGQDWRVSPKAKTVIRQKVPILLIMTSSEYNKSCLDFK